MLTFQRQDGGIIYQAENAEEREVLKRKASKPNLYGNLMKPYAHYEPTKGYSRNRKRTPGRPYIFVPIKVNIAVKPIEGLTVVASSILRSTGRFKKFFIKHFPATQSRRIKALVESLKGE